MSNALFKSLSISMVWDEEVKAIYYVLHEFGVESSGGVFWAESML